MATQNVKQIIIDSLDILRKREISKKETFKARAYAKVITQLKNYDQPITSFEDVQSIHGIGEKISEKIKEILETGKLKVAERAMELYPIDALDTLQNIYGVGPSKANELITQGIMNIQQLRERVKENPAILNEKQRIGLYYYEDLLERIPRSEMEQHRDKIFEVLPKNMKEFQTELVGSFRREVESSGDIDVLIRVPKGLTKKAVKEHFFEYVQKMIDDKYIVEVLALGEHKCMAICRLEGGKARRLDLLMTPDEEYAYSMLYFTGSDRFNVGFRQYTLEKGYTLNEHKLTPLRDNVPVPYYMSSENDIFKFLGLRWIEPSQRKDGNQIIPIRHKPKIVS
jgi:DNA polymerase lambda